MLEKADQGFLWCKVPKAASESWTSLFIQRWFRPKARLLMWKQQVSCPALLPAALRWPGLPPVPVAAPPPHRRPPPPRRQDSLQLDHGPPPVRAAALRIQVGGETR